MKDPKHWDRQLLATTLTDTVTRLVAEACLRRADEEIRMSKTVRWFILAGLVLLAIAFGTRFAPTSTTPEGWETVSYTHLRAHET